jgi:hypothetical protein
MLKALTPLLVSTLLLVPGTLFAQQSAPAKKPRFDCSQAKDPKACEERREKVNAAKSKAQKACEGKQGDARRDCMRKEMCAQSKDPAKCEAKAKERMTHRKQAMEACKGKQGEELKSCIRDQREKMRGKK